MMQEDVNISLCSDVNLQNTSIQDALWQLKDKTIAKEIVGVSDEDFAATNIGIGSKQYLSAAIYWSFQTDFCGFYQLLLGESCFVIQFLDCHAVIESAAPITTKGKVVHTCNSMSL